MGQDLQFLQGPLLLFEHLDKAFTFFLLVMRFAGMFLVIPGFGAQMKGIASKYSAILILSTTAMYSSPIVPLPSDLGLMAGALVSEVLLGAALGIVPLILVGIAQNAGQLSSTSMGLQAGAMIDPSTGGQVADVARLFGDLMTLTFLFVGGHHVVIYTVSGMGGQIIPGSFVLGQNTLEILIQKSSDVFGVGMLLAAPILVALLLTQFVMGLVSKAVPTVNIFIVSFPLTIGIGLLLTILMIPELVKAIEPLLTSLEGNLAVIAHEALLSP